MSSSNSQKEINTAIEGIIWLNQCSSSDPSKCNFCIAKELRQFTPLSDELIRIVRNKTLCIEPGTLFNTIPKKLGMLQLDMMYFDKHMIISVDLDGTMYRNSELFEMLSAAGLSFPYAPLVKVYFSEARNKSIMSVVTSGVSPMCLGQFTETSKNSQQYQWTSEFGFQDPVNINISHWPGHSKSGPRMVEIHHKNAGKITNTRPKWDEELMTNILRFKNHRVKATSLVNCRFDYTEDGNTGLNDKLENTVLQFGEKTPKEQYIIDVGWPFSIMDAVKLGLMQITYRS